MNILASCVNQESKNTLLNSIGIYHRNLVNDMIAKVVYPHLQ